MQQWDGGYAGEVGTVCHVSKGQAFILKNSCTSWAFANDYMQQLAKERHDVGLLNAHRAFVRAGRTITLFDLTNFKQISIKTLDTELRFATVLNGNLILVVFATNIVQILDPTCGWNCLAQSTIDSFRDVMQAYQMSEYTLFLFSQDEAYYVTFFSYALTIQKPDLKIDFYYFLKRKEKFIMHNDFLIVAQEWSNVKEILICKKATDWNCQRIECSDINFEHILLTKSCQLVVAYRHNRASKISIIDLLQELPTQLDVERGMPAPNCLVHIQEMKGRLFLTGKDEIMVVAHE